MSKCIYIAGYGRSGSTLFDTMLSNCDGYHGIGEASNIFDVISNNEDCSCGQRLQDCVFWSRFAQGVDATLVGREQRMAEGIWGWIFFNRAAHYRSFWLNFFDAAENDGLIVVDSSKISRATLCRPLNLSRLGVEISMVHLYRDPDDLLSSLLKGSNKSLAKGMHTSRIEHLFLMRSFFGAFFSNLLTFIVGKFFFRQYFFIRYEELITIPFDVFSRLGVRAEIGQDFSSLTPGHAVSGNRMRQSGEAISLNSDKVKRTGFRLPFFYKYLFRILRIFEN